VKSEQALQEKGSWENCIGVTISGEKENLWEGKEKEIAKAEI